MSNKILKLFDEQYIKNFFNQRILPQYPKFKGIESISIYAHKNIIRPNHTYHVVIEFITEFIGDQGNETISIFCTAHHNEPRIKVFKNLSFLWKYGFADNHFSIPKPLYFSKTFNATFYQGVAGQNLYYYIKKNDRDTINRVVGQTAGWLAKLHSTDTSSFPHDQTDGAIKLVVPTLDIILKRLESDYPQYHETFKKIYTILYKKEEDFFAQNNKLSLVHGDAHPENIIIISNDNIAMIDFVDLSQTDFARDLGCFLQQLNYMVMKKINDQNYSDFLRNKFLEEYSAKTKVKIDENLKDRIQTYYLWTQMRTAVFFLMKHDPEPNKVWPLINGVMRILKI